ncbi:MAG: ABC transporter substrate-binding protein [Chloroflexota bacterium]|nr:ABC transporter substrate-binding protein [Chloroflexota bacterium]
MQSGASDRGTPDLSPTRVTSRRSMLKGLVAIMAIGAVAPLAAACGQQSPAAPKVENKPAPAGAAPTAAVNTSAKPVAESKAEVKPAEVKPDAKPQPAEGTKGGSLKIAILGEPPALDYMFTTATVTNNTMWHVHETLFARDSKQVPQPFLVDNYEPSSDGTTAVLRLRQGVLFHNDKEMTSADVVASLKRYGSMAPRGRQIFNDVETVDATDKYTVTFKFKAPRTGILPVFLSRDALITTEEIANQFPKEKMTEYVGTGPYRFVEHQPDRFVKLARFDKYVADERPADGTAGRRVAYLDELQFIPVPEESVRADGVGTNEYHYGDSLAPDTYDKVKSYPNVEADIAKPYYWAVVHFNKKEGLFTNQKLREAVLRSASIEPIAQSAFGNKEFYRLDPAMAAPETAWFTDVGKDVWNNPDPERAKALMQEAGYDGTPIRWMSTKEYFYNYNAGLIFKQQLEAVGFKVDLQVMDWATLVRRRSDPKEYDVFVTAHESYSHPVLQPYIASTWPGFWESAEKDRLAAAIMAETDPTKAQDLIAQLQQLQYTEVPCLKYGEYFALRARSNKLMGMNNPSDPFFWNAWLA